MWKYQYDDSYFEVEHLFHKDLQDHELEELYSRHMRKH